VCEIRINGERAEFLLIKLLGRSHPGCTDYWDGNWIRAQVEVSAGGFRGHVIGDLRADEIVDFHAQLSRLFETLDGIAEFNTLESWLSMRAEGNGRGNIDFRCEIHDQPGIGNRLHCSLATDQTFLRTTLADLVDAVRQYPLIGAPDA
jgi:hypothetical protein